MRLQLFGAYTKRYQLIKRLSNRLDPFTVPVKKIAGGKAMKTVEIQVCMQYFRMLPTHKFKITCNRVDCVRSFFLRFLASIKFWRVKLWQNKDRFAKVFHCQHFPLYSIVQYKLVSWGSTQNIMYKTTHTHT